MTNANPLLLQPAIDIEAKVEDGYLGMGIFVPEDKLAVQEVTGLMQEMKSLLMEIGRTTHGMMGRAQRKRRACLQESLPWLYHLSSWMICFTVRAFWRRSNGSPLFVSYSFIVDLTSGLCVSRFWIAFPSMHTHLNIWNCYRYTMYLTTMKRGSPLSRGEKRPTGQSSYQCSRL